MLILNHRLLSEMNVRVSYIFHITMTTTFTVDSKVHILKYYYSSEITCSLFIRFM
jgi:hypothetical protein